VIEIFQRQPALAALPARSLGVLGSILHPKIIRAIVKHMKGYPETAELEFFEVDATQWQGLMEECLSIDPTWPIGVIGGDDRRFGPMIAGVAVVVGKS
jgi:hypothetical protein